MLRNRHITCYKPFVKSLAQLEEEGAIQVLRPLDHNPREPILAAVGELQFEVVATRLQEEYSVEASLEQLPIT